MIHRTIVGLVTLMIVCSCAQQTAKGELQIDNGPNQQVKFKSGLQIDNGINRGTGYTDSLETNYNLRYIPITITNDSTIPIHLQIAFSKEYDYPIAFNDRRFNVLPMPKEWALDGVEITDGMTDELPKYINEPTLNKTLEPGEELVLAIGTRYQPTGVGVLPNVLFTQSDSVHFQACDVATDQVGPTDPSLALFLKLSYYQGTSKESCIIIPCGQISYPGH